MLWLILLFILCAMWFFRRWRWLRLTSNIPTLPGSLPVIGIAYRTLGSAERLWKNIETWQQNSNALGGIVQMWMGPVLLIGDFTIPNGTGILLFINGVNRNEKYWGCDANEFKPDRWLHPSTLPNHPAAFASFSLGRRNCVGKSYAMMSLKTTVAHILRQYRVTADHTKLVLKFEYVLKPASGHFISIEER